MSATRPWLRAIPLFLLLATESPGRERLPLAGSITHAPVTLTAIQQGVDVVVQWSIAGDHGLAGFDLMRARERDTDYVRVNERLLYAAPQNIPQDYTYRDSPPAARTIYHYQLHLVFSDGSTTSTAPVTLVYESSALVGLSTTHAPRYKAITPDEPVTTAAPLLPGTREAAPASRIKMTVEARNVYYVDASSLAPLFGITETEVEQLIRNRMLRLSSQGIKHSWVPRRDQRGLFFYNPGHENLYTRKNVFWLEKNSPGLVVPPREGTPVFAPATPTFTTNTIVLEENKWHVYAAYYPLLDDYYIWDTLNAPTVSNILFTADHVHHDGPDGWLKLDAIGASNTGVPGEHELEVSLNGQVIGSVSWERNVPHQGNLAFSPTLLSNGVNTITLRARVDPLAGFSRIHLDRIELAFPVAAQAVNDALFLPAATVDGQVRVDGFAASEIYALEIPREHRLREVTGGLTTTNETGYSITLSAADQGGHDLYVLTTSGALSPLAMSAVAPQPLLATTNALDYLLITHPLLEPETRRLEAFRTNHNAGLRAGTFLIEDLYNAFTDGLEHPEAIRRFLAYTARHWAVRPGAVLLAGSATLDYKNYRNFNMNLVPMVLTSTPYGPYSADNLLADVEGDDGAPDFAIGRIPAVTLADMSNAVDKIIQHETALDTNLQALVFTDLADPSAGDFPRSGLNTAALFPEIYTTSFDYRTNSTDTARIRRVVTNTINQAETDVLVYFGHGGWDRLSGSKILANEHIPTLRNTGHFPVALLTTCWPNRHEWASLVSVHIGKNLMMQPGRGAIATWGPSGETLNAYLENSAGRFLGHLSADPALTLGEAARRALAGISADQSANAYFIETMTLLGDPLLTIK
jgi:hypothetical protein